jgi:phage FluMu gp28-like protein
MGAERIGRFVGGLDLGKKVDHTAYAIVRCDGESRRLVYLKRFPLETAYATVLGFVKVTTNKLHTIARILIDQTGSEYFVEDAKRALGGIVEGIMLSLPVKQEILGHLKQLMQNQLFTYPFDVNLTSELNVERFELTKTGQIQFSHPEGTHDDILWAVALAVYASRGPFFPQLKRSHTRWLDGPKS